MALGNVDWPRQNGGTAAYSLRAAGDVVAAISGHGTYIDWYCADDYPRATPRIADAPAAEGWGWQVAG